MHESRPATETVASLPEPEAVALPLAPGSCLAERYRLGAVLGAGGYGVVYRAVDEVSGRAVAVKALRAERLTASGRQRLQREASLLAGLDHPHLVKVLEAGESEGIAYLTMELVEGESLRDRLQRGPLQVPESVRIAREVLSSLAALHAHGVVHRDVKPGNVLLDADGRAKLADFGLVRRFDADATRATSSLAVVGTAEYLSPEQALGEELDGRSDLYSLGVVLFEMLSGRPVHERRSTFATVLAHLSQPAPDVRELRGEVPGWLASVVGRLLEREPGQRYGSAAEALADLEQGRMPRGTLRRRVLRWSVAAATGLVLAAVVGGAWAREHSRSAFDRIVFEGDRSVLGLDRAGRVLWRREGVTTIGNFVPLRWAGGKPRIAALLASPAETDPAARHRLTLLDPQSGSEVETLELPDAAGWAFTEFSNRYACQLRAFDLDGDGIDEIYAAYSHETLWPSYVSTYDPASRHSGVVFAAAGHHRPYAAADLDGDGRRELLLLGTSNRLGWYQALAAVRVVWTPGLTVGTGPGFLPAGTPDEERLIEQDRNLLWYALLPPGIYRGGNSPIEVDTTGRTLRVPYTDGRVMTVGFDGFRREDPVPALDPPARAAARRRAYERVRVAMRGLAAGHAAEAAAAALEVTAIAETAGDRLLAEWGERLRVRALAAGGAAAEADALASSLAKRSEAGLGVAMEAARAFHLAGDLERALAWYGRGVENSERRDVARRCWEYLEGEVLVLAELGRWSAIPVACRRAKEIDPSSVASKAEVYEAWARLRGGLPRDPGARELGFSPLSPDLPRVLRLEVLAAAGRDAGELLDEIDKERRAASETSFLLTSLRGELLSRLGRLPEARQAAREALAEARQRAASEIYARAFLRDLAARAARLERLTRDPRG